MRKIFQFSDRSTEVRFASLLSGGFTTMAVIHPPEKKLANAPQYTFPKKIIGMVGGTKYLGRMLEDVPTNF